MTGPLFHDGAAAAGGAFLVGMFLNLSGIGGAGDGCFGGVLPCEGRGDVGAWPGGGFTRAAISGGSAGEGLRAGTEPIDALLFSAFGPGTPREPPIEAALFVGLIGLGVIMLGGLAEIDTDLTFLSAG